MLEFQTVKEGYQIIQKTFSFKKTDVMIVTYSKDLSKKKINTDPWIETNESCRNWFNKYYLNKFV